MTEINKLKIFQTLMADANFIHNAKEESIVGNALIKEEWVTSLPEAKQERRKRFIIIGKKTRSVINLEYYEKMIIVYDLIIELLKKLNKMISYATLEEKTDNIIILRLTALILVEQGFIDEYIVPSKHVPYVYFQNISAEINFQYPELMINDFIKKYIEMYDIWPDKSKYEIP